MKEITQPLRSSISSCSLKYHPQELNQEGTEIAAGRYDCRTRKGWVPGAHVCEGLKDLGGSITLGRVCSSTCIF